jgi:uncharacterized RDD family membrane protein YckC
LSIGSYDEHRAAYEGAYGPPSWRPDPMPAAYAGWLRRVAAWLLDWLLTFSVLFVTAPFVGTSSERVTDPFGDPVLDPYGREQVELSTLGTVLMLLAALWTLGFWVWNRLVRQGRTGRSLGKSAMGIRLVRRSAGRPVGVWLALGREIGHVLDGFCYIGYLWPLWDSRKQTFADKIADTVVLRDAFAGVD